jgi:hypothetical protein
MATVLQFIRNKSDFDDEATVRVEPVGKFELKGIRRPLAAYNVVAAAS